MPTLENVDKKPKRKLKKKDKFAIENNFNNLSQKEIDKEIEFDEMVDLDKTMWLVLRNKKSCNNILKKYETHD